jgi:hypothetical protein
VEADLLRYYGVDLLDYHRGTLTARRVRVLIQHLPRDAALVRELHGETAEWGLTEHLLAATVDQLAVGNWLFVSANRDEHTDPPERPAPIPRPGAEGESATPAASPEQIAAFFGSPGGGS